MKLPIELYRFPEVLTGGVSCRSESGTHIILPSASEAYIRDALPICMRLLRQTDRLAAFFA